MNLWRPPNSATSGVPNRGMDACVRVYVYVYVHACLCVYVYVRVFEGQK